MTATDNFLAIDHISFVISNLEKSRRFYETVLGLRVDNSRPDLSFDGFWLTINHLQQIHLLLVKNHDPLERPEHGGRDRHAAFRVRDLSTIQQRLNDHGIVFTMSQSGRKALFVRDPDGNTLEILQ
ncbi:VOC family protein [Cocleimonas flava]|uniref:Glyoxylase I family protein n=1 Tax=Cocleimonas flava TaxID=634765 RepID=A0A4R1EYD8_9GAMM|nr:VOC family protein [Cocleimonas flava]TCJ86906.1 glyoxylase I family protein [Cocleimonas flava]